jgi:hypothetical protein
MHETVTKERMKKGWARFDKISNRNTK